MELITLWMGIGFLFAAYSVIANDSVQTLGTWIASNNQKVNWKIMWELRLQFFYGLCGTVGTSMAETFLMVVSIKYLFRRYNGIMPWLQDYY